jgi:hypothetical protein
MPTYTSLVQFTDKGIQAAKQTTQRVTDWAAKVDSMGVSVKSWPRCPDQVVEPGSVLVIDAKH